MMNDISKLEGLDLLPKGGVWAHSKRETVSGVKRWSMRAEVRHAGGGNRERVVNLACKTNEKGNKEKEKRRRGGKEEQKE
jgi:hypothetical protein